MRLLEEAPGTAVSRGGGVSVSRPKCTIDDRVSQAAGTQGTETGINDGGYSRTCQYRTGGCILDGNKRIGGCYGGVDLYREWYAFHAPGLCIIGSTVGVYHGEGTRPCLRMKGQ